MEEEPNKVIIVEGADASVSFTREAVDTLSAKIRAWLKEQSIGREDMVMINLPRSAASLISMLGIWKAGAAFVVVESSYPKDRIEYIKKDLSIWNINSFGEYYLQIFEKYRSDYELGLDKFKIAREKFVDALKSIDNLRVLPSQANYIMCEVLGDINSYELTKLLLNDYNLLIKDLSAKKGCDGKSYIRVAVRDEIDNGLLIDALKEILN